MSPKPKQCGGSKRRPTQDVTKGTTTPPPNEKVIPGKAKLPVVSSPANSRSLKVTSLPGPVTDDLSVTDPSPSKDAIMKCVRTVILSDDTLSPLLEEIAKRVADIVWKKLDTFNADVNEKLATLQSDIERKEIEIKKLEMDLERKCSDQEQYQRRVNLRLFGLPESQVMDDLSVVNLLNDNLNLKLTLSDIDRCHRVGPRHPHRHRAFIIRFSSYRARNIVFSNKRQLKGTGLTLREDLSNLRLRLLKSSIESFGVSNVWSVDGTVVVKDTTGKKHFLASFEDLNNLKSKSL